MVLVFGFIGIFVSLLYCMCICQEGKSYQRHPGQPELFWTHHWQKNITIPEIKSKAGGKENGGYWEQDRFPEDVSDTSSRDYPRQGFILGHEDWEPCTTSRDITDRRWVKIGFELRVK